MMKQIRYKRFTTKNDGLSSRSCDGNNNPGRKIMPVNNAYDNNHQWPDHVHP